MLVSDGIWIVSTVKVNIKQSKGIKAMRIPKFQMRNCLVNFKVSFNTGGGFCNTIKVVMNSECSTNNFSSIDLLDSLRVKKQRKKKRERQRETYGTYRKL
jgi:hypothetical protein